MENSASIYALVVIEHEEDGELDREFLVNYSHHETKLWLTRTQVWALTNQRTVFMRRATDAELNSKKLFIPNK